MPGLLATVGRLDASPGAPNVIPGAAVASLDVRHAEDAARQDGVAALREEAQAIGARRGVDVGWEERLDTPAVAVDAALADRLAAAVADAGLSVHRLPSGAGHDGVVLSQLTGIAMLFVRCAGGVSHHPDETVAESDVAAALDVLDGFLERLGA
jgi:allantoate deiminase